MTAKSILAHGVTGGTLDELRGGKFLQGFLAAGFAKLASPYIGKVDFGDATAAAEFTGILARTATAAVVGGTASVMGGGKFENGAITGAFSRLFNDEHDRAGNDKEALQVELFDSPKDAAMAALQETHALTARDGFEYGGEIFASPKSQVG